MTHKNHFLHIFKLNSYHNTVNRIC